RRPLTAGVDQGAEAELDELPGAGVVGRQEGAQAQGLVVDGCLLDLLWLVDRRTGGVPAAEDGEEDVLVAPDHAFGSARGTARVEDVVVIAGSRSEVAGGAALGDDRL